jgi:hypothetical protein
MSITITLYDEGRKFRDTLRARDVLTILLRTNYACGYKISGFIRLSLRNRGKLRV